MIFRKDMENQMKEKGLFVDVDVPFLDDLDVVVPVGGRVLRPALAGFLTDVDPDAHRQCVGDLEDA